jgi:DNA-binding PadR family transcriptional regulator
MSALTYNQHLIYPEKPEEKRRNMNKLSYGLLSLLFTEPMTGYDLTMKLNKFWPSAHSAIYPLLIELERKGFIEYRLEKQNSKPDKKIYNLTDSGKDILVEWFTSETSNSVTRDEMTLKLYCIKGMDTAAAGKLFDEFMEKHEKNIREYSKRIEQMKLMSGENPQNVSNALFGSYILTQRALNKFLLDLEWCAWVKRLYDIGDMSFLEKDFNMKKKDNL